MIINIRGTSGSGKTHLVRRIMDCYPHKMPFRAKDEKRKQPLGYILRHDPYDNKNNLLLVGHYETPCGGADTITEMQRIFDIVRKAHAEGHHVIYEGLLISADVNRTAALHLDGLPLTVIALNTPLDKCLESVNSRREARGKLEPVNPKHTTSKFTGVQQSMKRLEAQGVECVWASRDEAFEKIKELVNVA